MKTSAGWSFLTVVGSVLCSLSLVSGCERAAEGGDVPLELRNQSQYHTGAILNREEVVAKGMNPGETRHLKVDAGDILHLIWEEPQKMEAYRVPPGAIRVSITMRDPDEDLTIVTEVRGY